MPIKTRQFNLTNNVRVRIVDSMGIPQHVCIHNHEHSQNVEVYIGGSDVSLTNGIHAQSTLTSQITIGPDDELYAIADGNAEIHVLVVKQD
jgi:hypothetical protein